MSTQIRHSTIYQTTITCRQHFQRCLGIPNLMQREWARKRLADFNLWATSSGALGEELASLDQRLVSQPSVKKVIVNLLRLLQGLLVHCQREGDPNSTQDLSNSINATSNESDDSDDSYDSNSIDEGPVAPIPLSKALGDIEAIINQLVRISIAIRRAGTQERLDRADRSFDSDRHNELRDFLVLLVYANTLTSNQKASENLDLDSTSHCLTEVQSRLILANLRRRHRFLYAEKRWKKQAKEREAPVSIHIISEDTLSVKKAAESGESPQKPEPQSPQPLVKPTITPTLASTYPTIVQEPIVMPQGSQPSTTIASATNMKVAYPKAPEIPVDHDVFICPCCYLTLPHSLSQGQRWRKHLVEDILPYTCILDECPQPLRLYSSRADWMQHMTNDHARSQYWLCFACSRPVKFLEEKSFVSHLQIEHGEVISTDQIPMFVSDCACTLPLGISHCPLCPLPSLDIEDDNDAILDHIAEHVHSFSLNSLPWPTHGVRETEYVGSDGNNGDKCYFDVTSKNASKNQTRSSISEGSLQLYTSNAVEDDHLLPFDEPEPHFDSQNRYDPELGHILIGGQKSFQKKLDNVERQLIEALEMRDQETVKKMAKLVAYYKAKIDGDETDSEIEADVDPQRTGDPFAQQAKTGRSRAQAVHPVSKLPPLKLTSHSLALLNLFKDNSLSHSQSHSMNPVTEAHKWVCRLTTFFREESFTGAGFLVNIPNSTYFCILTAGHNIINERLGWAIKIQVNFPSGLEFVVGPSECHVSKAYEHRPTSDAMEDSSLLDYSLIVTKKEKHLASNRGQEDPGGCGFDILMQDIELLNADISVYGYTERDHERRVNASQLNHLDTRALYFSMTQGSNNGGPVIISKKGVYTAIGIHNYEGRATRLTGEVMFEILSWIDDYQLRRVLEVVPSKQPKVYLQATDGTQPSITARPGVAYLNFVLAVAPKSGSDRLCHYVILPGTASPAQDDPLLFLTLCDDEGSISLMFQTGGRIARKQVLFDIMMEGPRGQWTLLCWSQDISQFITVEPRKRAPLCDLRCIVQDDEVVVHRRPGTKLHMYPYDPTDNRMDQQDNRVLDLPPLYGAVLSRDSQTVIKLLDGGADASFCCTCGTTALSKACENGNLTIAKALFSHGARIETKNHDGESPEILAHRNGYEWHFNQLKNIHQQLLENLLHATTKGLIDEIKTLLNRGADPNALRDRGLFSGRSALGVAALCGHQDIVLFLLREAKVAATGVDGEGATALHYATVNEDEDATIIEYLLDFGADVNAVCQYALTPLHWAAQKGNVAAISALCDNMSIDLNPRDRGERTPLMLAVESGNAAAVKRLLQLSADPTLVDCYEETARDQAKRYKRFDIYDMLP